MQKALARQVQQRYPLTVVDLSKTELKSLIDVLSIENPAVFQKIYNIDGKREEKPNPNILRAIKNLSPDLRNKFMIQLVPNALLRAATLCATHKGLNPYIINHTFRLIKGEVTDQLGILDWYSNRLDHEVQNLVGALHAIEGMWWEPSSKNLIPPNGGAQYQENKCEACILARIGNNPMHLQNLRTALLSRTRTKKKHRAPKLLAFIDAGIVTYPNAFQLFTNSSETAYQMKATRKEAVRERKSTGKWEDIVGAPSPRCENETQSIFIYLDPRISKELESAGRNLAPNRPKTFGHLDQSHIIQNDCSSSRYSVPSTRREPLPSSEYTPPREGLAWQNIDPQDNSMVEDLINKIDDFLLELSPISESAEGGMEIVRPGNPLARQLEVFSDSEYNSAEWEDDSVSDPESGDTSWSLICADDQKPEFATRD